MRQNIYSVAALFLFSLSLSLNSCNESKSYSNDYYDNSDPSEEEWDYTPDDQVTEEDNQVTEVNAQISEETNEDKESSVSSKSPSSTSKNRALLLRLGKDVKNLVQAIKDEDKEKMARYNDEIELKYELPGEEESREFVAKQFDRYCKELNVPDDLILKYSSYFSCLRKN